MTKIDLAHPSERPEVSDLPPEISALIDAALAPPARPAAARRPLVAIADRCDEEASLPMRHNPRPAKRTRNPAFADIGLASLLAIAFLVCWMTALAGFNMARAAEGTGTLCTVQALSASGQPLRPVKFCNRLPQN
jgi:hypothetical protein